jgi:hypothetical protein
MQKYLASRGASIDSDPDLPLFVNVVGDVLKTDNFVSVTRLALSAAGFDPSLYSGHSFRAEAATTAGDQNFEEWELKILGCWASSAYSLYLRNPRIVTSFARRLVSD